VDGSRGELELTGQELRRRLGLKSTLVSFEMIADKSIANKKPSNTSSLVSAWFESSSNRRKTSLFARRNRSSSQNGSHQSDKALASSTSFPLLNAYSVPPPPLLVLKMPPSISSSDLVKKNILLVKGSGSGHGVGMSQWGAYGLAMKGVNFRRILTYYYKGVAIRTL
jgi:stage II sporulation protein D